MIVRFEPVCLQGDFNSTRHVTKANRRARVPGREHLEVDRFGLPSLEREAESQQEDRAPQGYPHGQRHRCVWVTEGALSKKQRNAIRVYFLWDTSQKVFFWHAVYKFSMVQFLMPQATPFCLTRNMIISVSRLICEQAWTYQIYLLSVISALC